MFCDISKNDITVICAYFFLKKAPFRDKTVHVLWKTFAAKCAYSFKDRVWFIKCKKCVFIQRKTSYDLFLFICTRYPSKTLNQVFLITLYRKGADTIPHMYVSYYQIIKSAYFYNKNNTLSDRLSDRLSVSRYICPSDTFMFKQDLR